MPKIKAVLFDLDYTLYKTGLQVSSARQSAVKAMIEAGLEVEQGQALRKLEAIVTKFGPNYDHHYDRLLESYGVKDKERIVAAGITAYHDTKLAYLKPYTDTVKTLLTLRDMGVKLGVVTEGVPVKQWEKLIRLGLSHFFHTVVINKGERKCAPDFGKALRGLGCVASEAVMVGDRLDKDVSPASEAGLTTVRLLKGKYVGKKLKCKPAKPDYSISTLSELPAIIKKINAK